MTSTLSRGTLVSVVSLFAATLYQENPDMNHKLWNSVSTLTLIYDIPELVVHIRIFLI
jgi:hypothetical protein